MQFVNVRKKSVKIGKDRKFETTFRCLPENAGCIPSAVVIMTTADGMHPACLQFRSLPRTNGSCRSACRHRTKFFCSPLYPCYLKARNYYHRHSRLSKPASELGLHFFCGIKLVALGKLNLVSLCI